jgi:Cu(I)/Ag(I) efflux system membrane protein CusA/SilA
MLLSVVFHSVMEAAHVILAVPFALTGGAILQYLLGYNFSVAVWIGYIALFGTAIQTGVVMVVYLEEALRKRLEERGDSFSLQDLKIAVIDGAMLRLRPRIMTVGTVVASLLPIMWSTRTGAEIMKPLATPVIGGMLSSLLHVLIVTPVIFYWLRRRAFETLEEGNFLPGYRQKTLGESRKTTIVAADAFPLCLSHCHYHACSPRRRDHSAVDADNSYGRFH